MWTFTRQNACGVDRKKCSSELMDGWMDGCMNARMLASYWLTCPGCVRLIRSAR